MDCPWLLRRYTVATQERKPEDMSPRKPAPMLTSMTQPPALSSTPDVMSLLKALKRRWLMAGALGVLAAAVAGAAVYVLMPARFTAFALMQVSSKADPLTERAMNHG